MGTGAHDEATLDALRAAQARLEHAGGYHWRDRAQAMLRGLGFGDDQLDRQLSTFSGGELTRGSLARTLAGDPDLLLLDEPTNHLDVASLEWLEQHLIELDAAVVLVAHDRWFLEAVGTAVLELEAGRSRFFAGPWHAWRKEKAARELALGRAIDRQQSRDRAPRALRRPVPREGDEVAPGAVAREAAREDRPDRARPARRARHWRSRSRPPERAGRVIFELEDGAGRGARRGTLLDHAELWLERGEHVALVGANGAGKTTLIETLAGKRPLAGGKLRKGHNVQVGYLSQHSEQLRRDRHGAGGRAAGDETDAEQGACAARPVPLLRRGGGEADRRPLGRRAPAPVARDPRALGRERADPRRADEPPRRREPRGARGGARGLPRLGAARLARPRAARRRRLAHGRGRGRHAAQLRRRLGRLPAHARGAQSARGGGSGRRRGGRQGRQARRRAKPVANGNGATSPGARRTRSARRRSSSARSKRPRRRCRRSRRSWQTRRHGRTPSAPPTRPSATQPPSARSRSCTRATSASPVPTLRHRLVTGTTHPLARSGRTVVP